MVLQVLALPPPALPPPSPPYLSGQLASKYMQSCNLNDKVISPGVLLNFLCQLPAEDIEAMRSQLPPQMEPCQLSLPPNSRLLLFGTSYMREITEAIAVAAGVTTVEGIWGHVRYTLSNGASIEAVYNYGPLQTYAGLQGLTDYVNGTASLAPFTHIFIMQPHNAEAFRQIWKYTAADVPEESRDKSACGFLGQLFGAFTAFYPKTKITHVVDWLKQENDDYPNSISTVPDGIRTLRTLPFVQQFPYIENEPPWNCETWDTSERFPSAVDFVLHARHAAIAICSSHCSKEASMCVQGIIPYIAQQMLAAGGITGAC
jgi:hypothetical protein